MEDKDLQVENGNFTRIVNPLIENLIKIPFKGCELAVALYIIRKTYGYNKTQDEISLSQFEKDLGRSRQTIVTALKNLQLVNIARLVKRGNIKGSSNIWAINKYSKDWKLVNMGRLVKRSKKPSLTEGKNLVYTPRHTKDNTKNNINTKDITPVAVWFSNLDVKEIYDYGISKGFTRNKEQTQAWAIGRMLETKPKDHILRGIDASINILGQLHAPVIKNFLDLEEKWVSLTSFYQRKNKEINESRKGLRI